MKINSPIIVSCCSFKGGAGRSTAAVNIAASIALKSNYVLLLDLDFGAPGIHDILHNCGIDFFPENYDDNDVSVDDEGLQHLFNLFSEREGGYNTPRAIDFFEERVFNLKKNIAQIATSDNYKEEILSTEGDLVYVPSSPHIPRMPWLEDSPEGVKSFKRRFQSIIPHIAMKIAPKLNFDFLILDAASGINERSNPIHEISDIIIVFYRQSIQHSLGAAEMANYFHIKQLAFPAWKRKRILCIPSCVEELTNVNLDLEIGDKILERYNFVKEVINRIPKDSRNIGDNLIIKDDPSMHFFERLIINEEGSNFMEDYMKIANHLIKISIDIRKGD